MTKRQFARNLEKWISGTYSSKLARVLYDYCQTELSEEHKKVRFPLYRGLGLTTKQLEKLGKIKQLKLSTRLISSWTTSFEVAAMFAGGEITMPELEYLDMDMPDQGVVIKLSAAPQAVVCNVGSLDDYLEEVEEELESLNYAYAEDEVLIDSAKARIDSINTNNLVAIVYDQKVYKGDSKIQKFFSKPLPKQIKEEPLQGPGSTGRAIKRREAVRLFFAKYSITDISFKPEPDPVNFDVIYLAKNEQDTWEKVLKSHFNDIKQSLERIKASFSDIIHVVATLSSSWQWNRIYIFFDNKSFILHKDQLEWINKSQTLESFFKNQYMVL
jgi:hypothetical protein